MSMLDNQLLKILEEQQKQLREQSTIIKNYQNLTQELEQRISIYEKNSIEMQNQVEQYQEILNKTLRTQTLDHLSKDLQTHVQTHVRREFKTYLEAFVSGLQIDEQIRWSITEQLNDQIKPLLNIFSNERMKIEQLHQEFTQLIQKLSTQL